MPRSEDELELLGSAEPAELSQFARGKKVDEAVREQVMAAERESNVENFF